MKKLRKKQRRPLGLRKQRAIAVELAKLALMSEAIFRDSVNVELDTLGDAANLLRSACGSLTALIGSMQRQANTLDRVGQEVKRTVEDPHGGFSKELRRLAKLLNG